MAPLQWGAKDHHGAASGEDGRRQLRDARNRHQQEEPILTPKKRPGPPLPPQGEVGETAGVWIAPAGCRSIKKRPEALAVPWELLHPWAQADLGGPPRPSLLCVRATPDVQQVLGDPDHPWGPSLPPVLAGRARLSHPWIRPDLAALASAPGWPTHGPTRQRGLRGYRGARIS
jgi:hypothetical protein